jgi:outer membrane biosynthesis protein TonB
MRLSFVQISMSKAYQLTVLAIALASMLSACRNRDGSLSRRTQEYEVITEGSASGVTSTLTAPGESPTPLVAAQPPLTDTNADTTTAFQILDSTVTTGSEQPGSLADTLPQERTLPRVSRPAPRPSSEPSSEPVTPSVAPPTRSEPEPQPDPEEREPEPEPEPESQEPAEDAGDEPESISNPE